MVQKKFEENTAREITANARLGWIKTRLGLNVRIVYWGAKGSYPIVALIEQADGSEVSRQYTLDGKVDQRPNVTTSFDLVIEEEGG